MKPTRRHRVALALLAVPVAASLAACSSGGLDATSSKSSAGGSADRAAAPAVSDYNAAEGGVAKDAVSANLVQRAVIATGVLQLTSRHLSDARLDAIGLVTGFGGNVADEQSQSDNHGRLDRVELTLRVPAASFERALDGLGRLGTVRHRQQSVEDVTTQVIDNDARIKAQEASVASIERLLTRATTIADIIAIERQLSTRQADLDSLKQQQKYLADQTSMSTIQLLMTPPAARHAETATGFLGGLKNGWRALGTSTVAVGTAVGAVLPFAVLLALIGGPAWLLVRRRRVVAPAPAAEA